MFPAVFQLTDQDFHWNVADWTVWVVDKYLESGIA